jgi:hypothetical protein
MDQVASVTPVTLGDGSERGVRAFDVENSSGLRIQVLADRALDIGAASYKGINLCWHSPAGFANPAFYEPEGDGWLRTFGGGLLVTCGLTNVGPPATENGRSYGQHGRIGNIPAEKVSYGGAWQDDRYLLTVSGQIRQGVLFGENLIMHRAISMALGEPKIEIETVIENAGFEPSPLMLLFHCNFGWPLIDSGTKLAGNFVNIKPRDEEAAKNQENALTFEGPAPGYKEKVYFLAPSENNPRISLVNEKLPLTVSFQYNREELTHLTEWKMMGQGAYVVGIEPGNCHPISITEARKKNDLQFIAPGEKKRFALTIEVME